MRKVIHSWAYRSYLCTSFLGAFNDNFFKLLLVCFARTILPDAAQKTYIPLSGMLFVAPYLLFSNYAGWIADRFAKSKVLAAAKWLEILVMLLGLLLFLMRSPYALLAVLFWMGAQSALYSPAKYGYMPETLPEHELPEGNGLTQFTTYIAIIAGTWAGGILAYSPNAVPPRPLWAGPLLCVLIAGFGTITSYFVAKTPDGSPQARFQWNPIGGHWGTWKELQKTPALLLQFCIASSFWCMGALFQNHLPLLMKNFSEVELSYALGALGIGIGIGCICCGKCCRGQLTTKFLFPSGLIMALCFLVLGIWNQSLPLILGISLLLGIAGGFYQLPMSTACQQNSPAEKRGSYLSFGNALDCLAMLSAYALQFCLLKAHLPVPHVFTVMAGLILLLLVVIRKATRSMCYHGSR